MQRINHKFRKLIIVILVAVLAVTAFSAPSATLGQEDDPSYSVAVTASYSGAAMIVADAKGFFDAEGIDVEINVLVPTDYIPAVTNYRLDIFHGPMSNVLEYASSEDGYLVVTGEYVNVSSARQLVIAQGIEPSEIERIAIPSDVAYWKNFAQHYLEEHGMTLDDIQFVVLPIADILPNMQSGRIQGNVGVQGITLPLVQAGVGEIVAEFSESVALVMRNAAFERMPDETKAGLWRAIIHANEWMSDPENGDELQQVLIEGWGDLAQSVGVVDDALFSLQYANHHFLTGEELLETNLSLEQRFLDTIAFKESLGEDVSSDSVFHTVDQTALLQVLTEMGYEEPDNNSG